MDSWGTARSHIYGLAWMSLPPLANQTAWGLSEANGQCKPAGRRSPLATSGPTFGLDGALANKMSAGRGWPQSGAVAANPLVAARSREQKNSRARFSAGCQEVGLLHQFPRWGFSRPVSHHGSVLQLHLVDPVTRSNSIAKASTVQS